MALDANILLQGRAPDLMTALSRGLQAGQSIRNAPLLRKIRENQANGVTPQEQMLNRQMDQAGYTPEQKQAVFRQILERQASGRQSVGSPRGFAPVLGLQGESKVQIGTQFNPATGQYESQVIPLPEGVSLASETPEEKTQRELLEAKEKANIQTKTKVQGIVKGGAAERGQNTIQVGLDAAKGIPVLRRTLGLLNSVETGGFNNVALRVKQTLGIEGADEGELSANMGQAILGDLRATFGAAFTEREGQRLEKIRANFGKNPETNKRLIRQSIEIAEDSAKRAMRQAADDDDFRTAQEIQDFLDFKFDFGEGQQSNEVTPSVQTSASVRDLSDEDLLNKMGM